MTPLDRQLAHTFRKARWGETAQPQCPSCYDALDLSAPVPDPLTPGLSRYTCRVCHVTFSDVKSTALYTSKPVPLVQWAYLVLHGDPRLLEWPEKGVQRCFDLVFRIKGQPLAAAWRAELETARVSVERLRQRLRRHPEAA